MFIPTKHLRDPGLLQPGRKPVGSVELDKSHPLAGGLGNYTYIDRFGMRDLAHDCAMDLYSGSGTTGHIDTETSHSPAFNSEDTNTYFKLSEALTFTGESKYTLMVTARVHSHDSWSQLTSYHGAQNTALGITVNSSSKYFINASSSSSWTNPNWSIVTDTDNWCTLVGVSNTTSWAAMVMFNHGTGELHVNEVTSGSFPYLPSNHIVDRIHFSCDPRYGNGRSADCLISQSLFWNQRAITLDSAINLAMNPYQIVKPRRA